MENRTRAFIRAAGALLALAVAAPPAPGADAPAPRKILIIDSFGPEVPPFGTAATAFRTAVVRELGQPVDIYRASLDAARFAEPDKERFLADFLRQRFGGRKLDLIVPIAAPATEFTARYRERLFPEVPVLILGTERRHLTPALLAPAAAVVSQDVNLPGIVENILQVLPETKEIAVVMGTTALERFWLGEMRREFLPFSGRVRFTWYDALPFEEMRKRAGALGPGSAILFGMMILDASGVPYDNDDALQSLRAAAKAPVFGYFQSQLGQGIVGGALYQDRGIGEAAARVAAVILEGEPPPAAPRTFRDGAPAYDWRELDRWGISESRLPPGSQVLYRQPGLWQAHRGPMVGVVALVLLQALLIAALVAQEARRRRAEAALRDSEADSRRVMDTAMAVPWVANIETWAFTFVGPQAVKLLGYPAARWYERDFWTAHIHPQDRDAAVAACLGGCRAGGDFELEYRMIAAGGRIVWIHDVVHCEHRNGKPAALRGLLLDVTARKQAEAELRESEERFRVMANTAPVMIWMSAPDKLCNFFNKPWLDFTGRTLEQELGEGWAQGVHPDDLERCLETYTSAFDARRPFTTEYRLRRADGEFCPVLDTGVPRFAPEGTFAGYIGSVIDLTDRKRAEAEVQRQRSELAHVARISMLGELAASLAHELNQPLTAILSNAQAARRFLSQGRHADVAEMQEILQDIIEENRRAAEVIRRMRALARKEELELGWIDLPGALRDVAVLAHSDAVLRNVRVSFEFGRELPPVHADKVQLQQVALNLLLNAFDAMHEAPAGEREVTVRAQPDGAGTLKVAVSDRGSGIPADSLERIFQPFYTTKREGLGMGLSISRSIVEAHGGRLWAENNGEHGGDRGATFYFTVPVQRPAAQP